MKQTAKVTTAVYEVVKVTEITRADEKNDQTIDEERVKEKTEEDVKVAEDKDDDLIFLGSRQSENSMVLNDPLKENDFETLRSKTGELSGTVISLFFNKMRENRLVPEDLCGLEHTSRGCNGNFTSHVDKKFVQVIHVNGNATPLPEMKEKVTLETLEVRLDSQFPATVPAKHIQHSKELPLHKKVTQQEKTISLLTSTMELQQKNNELLVDLMDAFLKQ